MSLLRRLGLPKRKLGGLIQTLVLLLGLLFLVRIFVPGGHPSEEAEKIRLKIQDHLVEKDMKDTVRGGLKVQPDVAMPNLDLPTNENQDWVRSYFPYFLTISIL